MLRAISPNRAGLRALTAADARAQPGLDAVTALSDLLTSAWERAAPMASSRCPWGAAQDQPPRAWMPDRSPPMARPHPAAPRLPDPAPYTLAGIPKREGATGADG